MSHPYYVNANGCWIWRGYIASNGYPASYDGKRIVYAHRAYHEAFIGPVEGKAVLHICDEPTCVNPSHLRLGTQADNMKDMWSKGRGATGERSGGAKLSKKQVEDIRRLKSEGGRVGWLARFFAISHAQVSRIVSGDRWKS
jgi:hypothetical protein